MDMSGNSSNEASDSDDSFDESNRRYEDIILRAGQHGTEASGANGWEYGAYSERGSQFSGNLPHRVVSYDAFSLGFNTADPLILGKAKIEIEQCLMQVRLKVFDSKNGQRISYAEAIAGAFPPDVFKLFHAWLKTAPF